MNQYRVGDLLICFDNAGFSGILVSQDDQFYHVRTLKSKRVIKFHKTWADLNLKKD
jgi:hypothetical protein